MVEERNEIQMYSPLPDFHCHRDEYQNALINVCLHGKFINGSEITELEQQLADYVGVPNCIAVSSGTDALLVGLMALNVGPGDEIITVAHTWISSSEVISVLGAKPIFIDIDPETFLMDINLIEEKVTEKTKGIIFVSIYGQMGEPEKLTRLANKLGLWVIDDAAQSFGCCRNNVKSGAWGDLSCTSFFPSKPLGGYGDSGACFTRSADLALKIRAIKNHGGLARFKHQYIGLNARMDTIQAAVLLVKLKYFDESLKRRREIADFYSKELSGVVGLKVPLIVNGTQHAWAQYSLLVDQRINRDLIVEKLKEKKIMVAVFYPKGLHEQPCFGVEDLVLEKTEMVCRCVLNLPLYPELTQEEIEYVVEVLKEVMRVENIR